ncbi:hypothetical protein TNIN_87681 [Trichonephila inaurata madagascariensis]|uniref:Uncharacterized protein n=1 Tax=Trichonephila inaurata madagascariensis TaxID=2747483 RepID=A0A8X6YFR7_9ARAC|nr:hypothetical protein TNIN_87681 [Trichonephila inaurata madagascariensis]
MSLGRRHLGWFLSKCPHFSMGRFGLPVQPNVPSHYSSRQFEQNLLSNPVPSSSQLTDFQPLKVVLQRGREERPELEKSFMKGRGQAEEIPLVP